MPRVRQKADIYRNQDFQKAVGVQLKTLGLQQHDLAQYLGVCDGTVSIMLKAPEKIPISRLRKIIEYCQLDPATVLLFVGFSGKAIKAMGAGKYDTAGT